MQLLSASKLACPNYVSMICGKLASIIVMFEGEGGWVLDVKPRFYITKTLITTLLCHYIMLEGRGLRP